MALAVVGCGDADVPNAAAGMLSPPGPCDLDGTGADGIIDTFHTLAPTDAVTRMASDGTALYWVDKLGERILRQGFDDAAPEVFVTGYIAGGPILDDGFVYWQANDALEPTASIVRRAPMENGTAVVDLITGPPTDSGFAVDAEWLYFAEVTDAASSIRRMPKGGGAAETLIDGEYRVFQIAVDATAVYWIAYASADPPDPSEGSFDPVTAIRSLAHGATVAETLLDGGPGVLSPSAAGDGVLYYLDYHGGFSLDVYGWSGIGALAPGQPVWVPASGPSTFSAPVSDAACVYWVAPRPPLSEEGGLYDLQRAAHGGGLVETIATLDIGDNAQRHPAVALGPDAVYWSLGSAYTAEKYIYRTSK
jgi:hypothetical protein